MDDLIRRGDAIDLLKKWADGYDYIETETESAIKEFCDLPSIHPERKKGHWEHVEIYSANSSSLVYKLPSCSCSECGVMIDGEANFCPNCGSYMRGEGNG